MDAAGQSAEDVADHEHVYRCQDCDEIGRPPSPDAYALGYEAGKDAGDVTLWAKGYQDGFRYLRKQIEMLMADLANEPIPAHHDGDVCS